MQVHGTTSQHIELVTAHPSACHRSYADNSSPQIDGVSQFHHPSAYIKWYPPPSIIFPMELKIQFADELQTWIF